MEFLGERVVGAITAQKIRGETTCIYFHSYGRCSSRPLQGGIYMSKVKVSRAILCILWM
jgi:hypothetical protein